MPRLIHYVLVVSIVAPNGDLCFLEATKICNFSLFTAVHFSSSTKGFSSVNDLQNQVVLFEATKNQSADQI